MADRRFILMSLLTAAMLIATLSGCVGLSRPFPLSRRTARLVQDGSPEMSRGRLARMCRKSAEPCATAQANEPKEISVAQH